MASNVGIVKYSFGFGRRVKLLFWTLSRTLFYTFYNNIFNMNVITKFIVYGNTKLSFIKGIYNLKMVN